MGETSNISRMANIVSSEIFNFFRWEMVGPPDMNFECVHLEEHFPKQEDGKEASKKRTHPTDVVFYYQDPYTGSDVYVNTDLKSYAASSITSAGVRRWLNSLGKSIQCAVSSSEWRERYCTKGVDDVEVVGMLFIYNHDGLYNKNFYDYFDKEKNKATANAKKSTERHIRPESIYVAPGQSCAIFDPALVQQLYNIVIDVNLLRAKYLFPHGNGYKFFYPSLIMHRSRKEEFDCPATIEALTDPYLIIWHDSIMIDGKTQCHAGYLIYYNRLNPTYRDFIYFFDKLSQFQIFEGEFNVRIRVQPNINPDYFSIFKRAIDEYASFWGFDQDKKDKFSKIDMSKITNMPQNLIEQDVGRK